MATLDEVLSFWFGELDTLGSADAFHSARWWKKDAAFDAEIRERFLRDHEDVSAGRRQAWLVDPRGRLATVILLDQFPRNMFRGSSRMFATDSLARDVAVAGMQQGDDRRVGLDGRVFSYMPLMHSEALADQERCVSEFEGLRDELEGPARKRAEFNLKYAIQHRDIIARFGRFPHRNEIVGRASTPEETAFLQEPGSSF